MTDSFNMMLAVKTAELLSLHAQKSLVTGNA